MDNKKHPAENIWNQSDAKMRFGQKEKFLADMLEKANALVIIVDNEGAVIEFNQRAEEIIGFKKKEILGKNYFDILIPDCVKDEVKDFFQKTLKEYQTEHTHPIRSKSGEEHFLECRTTTMFDESNRPIAICCMGIDITEQTKA